MIRSLRERLFIGLTAMIVLTGAIAGLFAYEWAFDEAIEIQDSALIQIASLAHNRSFKGSLQTPEIEEDAQVWLLELGTAAHGTSNERQLFALKDGLHTASWKGQPIRVLLRTRPDGSRYAAAQPTAIRDDTADEMALRTLLPIAALIPCLLMVTALVIARSLHPMIQLATSLDARRADDLTLLPEANAPTELQPFILSINRLFARVQRSMDQQRRFVADAAHELRTPIAALSLQAENLDLVELPEEARNRLAALRCGMHRTRHLLAQLLAFARYEATPSSSEMQLVALDESAKEVAADLLPQADNRGVDLGFGRVEQVTVRGEPVMLAALIRNLLDNALRHTPHGGSIDVGVYRQGGTAVLQVEDSGSGIAAADLDRIFAPFVRGPCPEGEGAGLGLSIVKRILDRMGGEIVLENIAGSGRTGLRATVRLPIPVS